MPYHNHHKNLTEHPTMQQIKRLADQRYWRPQAATRNLHPQNVLIM